MGKYKITGVNRNSGEAESFDVEAKSLVEAIAKAKALDVMVAGVNGIGVDELLGAVPSKPVGPAPTRKERIAEQVEALGNDRRNVAKEAVIIVVGVFFALMVLLLLSLYA